MTHTGKFVYQTLQNIKVGSTRVKRPTGVFMHQIFHTHKDYGTTLQESEAGFGESDLQILRPPDGYSEEEVSIIITALSVDGPKTQLQLGWLRT